MYYIDNQTANIEISGGNMFEVKQFTSVEDVATLIETFELVLNEVGSSRISRVLENGRGNYIFVISDDEVTDFDFYGYVNSLYTGNIAVNCVNARLMFPRSKSRGVYVGDNDDIEEVTGDVESEATSFMDEDELDDIVSGKVCKLMYMKTGAKLSIDETGIILGRSAKKADFVIHSNSNVSRQHARVFKSGSCYFVHNYEPPNGTYVDGLKVQPNSDMELEEGSTLLLADEEFQLV